MRALGACMFVGRNLPVSYYSLFKKEICAAAAGSFHGIPTDRRIHEMSAVIDRYVEALAEESPTSFALAYLERAYADNPIQEKLFYVGVFQVPMGIALAVFESTRGGYCMLKFGLSFDQVRALQKAEKTE